MFEHDICEAAEWRVSLYAPLIREMLETVGSGYFAGKRLLEVGSGSGNYAILLAKLGADVTGIELSEDKTLLAMRRAAAAGVMAKCRFRVDDFFQLSERFDGIVGKSVLYGIRDLDTYDRWLAQFSRMLLPGGEAVFIENGSGNMLVRYYRRYLHRFKGYSDNVLSNPAVLSMFEKHFDIVDLRPHYSFSQFVPLKPLIDLDFRRHQPFESCFAFWIRLRKRRLPAADV